MTDDNGCLECGEKFDRRGALFHKKGCPSGVGKEALLKKRDRIRWLIDHPVWHTDQRGERTHWGYWSAIDYEIVFVNPATEAIEDDDALNTEFRVWIEAGPPWFEEGEVVDGEVEDFYIGSHDINLDCGAPTMEEAMLKLADLVEMHYTDEGRDRKPEQHGGKP